MKKYEYLAIDPDEFIGSSRGMEDQEVLDIYGNAGWELTQIYTEPQCHYPVVKIKMYFKREINPYRFYQY